MRMMDELKPLFLYSASKKVYVPINERDRKKISSREFMDFDDDGMHM